MVCFNFFVLHFPYLVVIVQLCIKWICIKKRELWFSHSDMKALFFLALTFFSFGCYYKDCSFGYIYFIQLLFHTCSNEKRMPFSVFYLQSKYLFTPHKISFEYSRCTVWSCPTHETDTTQSGPSDYSSRRERRLVIILIQTFLYVSLLKPTPKLKTSEDKIGICHKIT